MIYDRCAGALQQTVDDLVVAGVDHGDVDGFEVDLRSALVGVAQSVADDADRQLVLTGDGGPGVARPVHAQALRDIRPDSNHLQKPVHATLHIAVLVALPDAALWIMGSIYLLPDA